MPGETEASRSLIRKIQDKLKREPDPTCAVRLLTDAEGVQPQDWSYVTEITREPTTTRQLQTPDNRHVVDITFCRRNARSDCVVTARTTRPPGKKSRPDSLIVGPTSQIFVADQNGKAFKAFEIRPRVSAHTTKASIDLHEARRIVALE